jgi:hypothetical protein
MTANHEREIRTMTETRPLYTIAREIRADWRKPNFAAAPYLRAMADLDSIDDAYGHDAGRGIVSYFLANASTWRGPVARAIKAELKDMLKGRSTAATRKGAATRRGVDGRDRCQHCGGENH